MDSIVVKGGTPLKGIIQNSGSKNAALPIMAASLLTSGRLKLINIPKLTDIHTMIQLLKNHGAEVEINHENNQLALIIDSSKINNLTAPYDIVRKMRASIWVLGPLVSRFGSAKVSLPGGCAIGARQVDLHLSALESMGAEINIEDGYIVAKAKKRLQGAHFNFNKVSVGATITAIMAASLAEGETYLLNCAKEPEIVDLCNCLKKMGAAIDGVGTNELRIAGKQDLNSAEYKVMPDRIEAGTYMIAAGISKGDLLIKGISYNVVENLALKLIAAGLEVTNNDEGIRVRYTGSLEPVDIQTQPYPGFATDLQAQFMSLMTVANGASVITETIFENRMMHVPELTRMGANIKLNANSAIVRGVKSLKAAEVMASDLRASVSLILAGLAAEGETKINRVYHLDRGYQGLEEKLSSCGANIRRIHKESI